VVIGMADGKRLLVIRKIAERITKKEEERLWL
jgi:hypothetical protein